MTVESFFVDFGHLADAPNGVQKLRELILQLAVQGKLVAQDPNDEPASVMLERICNQKLVKPAKNLYPISPDEIPHNLPASWRWVRFREVVDFNIGRTPPTKTSAYWDDDGIPWVSIADLNHFGLVAETKKGVSQKAQKDIFRSEPVPRGTILMSFKLTIGKISILDVDAYHNEAIISIFPALQDSRDFFFRTLPAVAVGGDTSNAIKGKTLNSGSLANLLFPLPPLEEQKRIVAKVDQLMALCNELEARQQKQQQGRVRLINSALDALLTARKPDEFANNWHRISTNFDLLYDHPETIARLRAAILQLAVQGKLVPQNHNDEPALVLLERIKAEKERLVKEGKIKKQKKLPAIKDEEKSFDLPVGWEWTRVWNVAELITSGSRGWAKYYSDKGPIFVTMGNLSRGHYKLRMKTIRYVNPPKTGEGSRTKLIENDLLISITGDVGNLGLIPKDFGEAYINQHTCLLRFMPDCQNKFFPELMRSPLAKLQYDAPQRGIKNSFRLGDVGEMIIPIPPLQEQKRIVTKVDQLMILCDELEAKLNQAQQHSEKLMEATVRQLLVA